MFGVSPSAAAIKSAETFKKEGVTNILELGAGQGRDTLFFASNEIIKFLISVLLIAPFAFFMGMPFPLSMAWLEKHFKEGIPWLGGLMDALL